MSTGHTTVLIAEDDPATARLLADQLCDTPGLKVVGVAEDGVEALAMTRLLRPHVLLLDLIMPKMSGIGVLQMLRNEAPELRPRVIVLSRVDHENTISRVLALGAEFCFTKPVRVPELIQTLWRPGKPTAEELLDRMLSEDRGCAAFYWAASALRALAADPTLTMRLAYDPAMTAWHVTYSAVEKGIRDLIKRAEQRGSFTYRGYFTEHPCASIFLRRLAKEIEL